MSLSSSPAANRPLSVQVLFNKESLEQRRTRTWCQCVGIRAERRLITATISSANGQWRSSQQCNQPRLDPIWQSQKMDRLSQRFAFFLCSAPPIGRSFFAFLLLTCVSEMNKSSYWPYNPHRSTFGPSSSSDASSAPRDWWPVPCLV